MKEEKVCRYLEDTTIHKCDRHINGIFYTKSGEKGDCKTSFWGCSYRSLMKELEEAYILLKTQQYHLLKQGEEIALLKGKLESKEG